MLRVSATSSLIKIVQRQISMTAPALQQAKTDPVKQAFADKVREYAQKQKALGDQKLVDATAEVNKAYQEELERVQRYYGAKGDDFTKFPSLQFDDPKIDPTDLHEPKQEDNLRW